MATQTAVYLTATQTAYHFTAGPVQLTLNFTAPLLPAELDVLSRPVNYVTFQVRAADARAHAVQLYFGIAPDLAVNQPSQLVSWRRGTAGNLQTLRVGTTTQSVLTAKGDDASYQQLAQHMAQQWQQMAREGDHYRLTFDGAGTWSQKYNLVWDKLLGLKVFPPEVAATEVRYYLAHQQQFGVPLDSRKTYSKSDWILWSATLATDPADFARLVQPVYRFANETPTRVPLSDWHETIDGTSGGFRARSVVGGYFIKLLEAHFAKNGK